MVTKFIINFNPRPEYSYTHQLVDVRRGTDVASDGLSVELLLRSQKCYACDKQ